MTGITEVLQTLHDGEHALEQRLRTAADTHRADHEIHHVALDLARWSGLHAARIREIAPDYGLPAPSAPATAPNSREDGPFSRRPRNTLPAGLVLLRDLAELHLAATANSLAWEMLAQAARAMRDDHLLGLANDCHPQTLRQMRWTDTQVKVLAPQILTST